MPQLIINTYVSLMYELKKKIGKVLASKSVGTGPSSYDKRIYRTAVSQRLRNTELHAPAIVAVVRPTCREQRNDSGHCGP